MEEFKYLVLKTFSDWGEGHGQGIRMRPDGSISLWPEQQPFTLEGIAQPDVSGVIGHPTGFAVDPTDNLFVIDAENCRIHHYRLDENIKLIRYFGQRGCFAGQFDFTFTQPPYVGGGLALDRQTLYVADTGNHRVQAFYRFNCQIRFILDESSSLAETPRKNIPGAFNSPTQIVVDSQGDLYVLDYGNRRILKFNRQAIFLNQLVPRQNPSAQPINMAVDPKDNICVLYAGIPRIVRFDRYGNELKSLGDFNEIRKKILRRKDEGLSASAIAIDKDNLIYIGERAASHERKLMIHVLAQDGHYLGSFGDYRQGCSQLSVDRDGNLYANCGPGGSLTAFRSNGKFTAPGVYYSKIFDSNEKEMQWHRIVMDADIPQKTKIEVFFRTSNDVYDLMHIRSGQSENTWSRLLSAPHNDLHSKDGLFLNGMGQYLRLKIKILGDGNQTPVLREVKVYFPRLSYLRYLPITYTEDPISREFLERFLSIFESMSFDMEQNIENLTRYFDPESVDTRFLNWLGSWLAISWDENWTVEKKREFIKQAYGLYRDRGTLRGLKAMVELFTEKKAAILEHFRFRSPMVVGPKSHSIIGVTTVVGKRVPKRLVLSENSKIGEFALEEGITPPEKPFGENAFDFTIFADTTGLKNKDQIEAVKRMIDEEKPAHTRCSIRTITESLRPWMSPLLEINTILKKGFPTMRLGKESYLGKTSFLGTRYCMQGTIGIRSKIDVDTVLH
jgi:phage tail-like protein